jgi:GTPase SAR1 family protein
MISDYKIVLLGDSGVGKTSFVQKLLYDYYDDDYMVSFDINLSIHMNIEKRVCYSFFDNAYSDEDLHEDTDLYILMYDDRKETRKSILYWSNVINQSDNNVPTIIIRNKSDLFTDVDRNNCSISVKNDNINGILDVIYDQLN